VTATGVLEAQEAEVVRAAACILARVWALQGVTVEAALQSEFKTTI